MLTLDSKEIKISKTDQAALDQSQHEEQQISAQIDLMWLQWSKRSFKFSEAVTFIIATRMIPPTQIESVE